LPDYDVNSAVDTTGLVGLWHMNGDANDTSGNNNHGTINGATTGTEGKLDTAMSFDGTNDYVDVGTPLGSTSSGTKAVSLWVKSIEATTGYVIANYDSNSHGFSLLFNSDRTIGIAWTSTINAVKTTDTLPLNEWFHVVGIFETGATGGKIYIDGTESVSGNLGTEQTTTNKLRISGRWVTANSGSTVVFNGSIDEVAIWNRALSPDEISAIYNTQKDNHPSSGDYESKVFDAGSIAEWNNISWAEDVPYGEELPDNGAVETVSGGANMTGNVLLMHMDEASGTIEDTSGNNNDGTASGGVTYEASGKFDKALSFDGSTGYVERSYDPDFTPGTNSWTVEAWVKTSSGGNSKSIVDWYRCGADPSCSSSDSASYLLGISSNNKSYWYVRDDYSNKVTLVSPSSVVDNSWHHLVGTYSPSPDSIKLYVDGVEVNSSSSVNFISLSSGGTSIPLEIGRHYIRSWGSPSSYFNGLIDEVAIFNRALSADEILDHYKRGALRLNISAKSCDDADCAGETTWDKTCTSSSCNISTLSNSQYLQYKIDMRSDSSSTPEVSSVSVFYGIAANPFTVGGIELIYRTPVNITEDSGSSLTDYQVLLTVDTASLISAGKMQADCDDIRITDSDGSTELSYWLESGCNTASTRLWVKVPSLAASSTKTLYMYYGNASISTESNGSETFPTLFKDFENDDLSDWDKDSFSAFETSTEQFVSGMKSLKAYWSGTGIPKASLPITVSKDYIIEFDYMEKSGTNEPPRFVLAEIIKSIGGISFASFIYNSPYYIYFLNSSSMGQTFVTGLSSNTWYHLAINPKEDTDTFDLWFDNSVTKTISDGTIYNGDISTFNYFTISLGKGGGPTTSTAYFDNLRIRKYTSTEPTYTIGSEQQNVATPCTDNDGDGYGAEGTNLSQCTNPTVPDCNDTNADINPEAYDIVGNGIDEDCSGADADYNFSIETDFLYPSETSTYYVGDDIWYQVTIKRDGVLYDPPGIELNLTNHYGTLYGSHIKSDMTHVSSGVYKGYFDSTTFDNSVPDIRYDVWIYGDMNEQLDYNVHYDFTFPDGTVPSFISTAY
ncbi:MAG: DUF2341 domain-containing protein, partial [Nanoarchaeota archaeon]|nr:DUF2341 domain-containing protein [Nanoarchaeota archaeon]